MYDNKRENKERGEPYYTIFKWKMASSLSISFQICIIQFRVDFYKTDFGHFPLKTNGMPSTTRIRRTLKSLLFKKMSSKGAYNIQFIWNIDV